MCDCKTKCKDCVYENTPLDSPVMTNCACNGMCAKKASKPAFNSAINDKNTLHAVEDSFYEICNRLEIGNREAIDILARIQANLTIRLAEMVIERKLSQAFSMSQMPTMPATPKGDLYQ